MTTYKPTCDDNDPKFMFATTHTSLLSAIMQGKVAVMDYVARELANRGLNERGEWVGFAEAERQLRDYFENA